ncbi:MAG: exonuclease domain-containing protein [Anaerovoracaceae bacterium]
MTEKQHGKQIYEPVDDFVIFDLETTGLSPYEDKIIEISAIKVRDGEASSEYSTLVDPGCHVPFAATAINNITDEMLDGQPRIGEALEGFLDFAGSDVLMGHNIERFDLPFIYRDSSELFGAEPVNDYVDTLTISKLCLPDLKRHDLGTLAGYYGISTEGEHRALNDCRINLGVYYAMRQKDPGLSRIKICPKCGRPMVKRSGRFGEFYGCSGYPECRYTENIRRG